MADNKDNLFPQSSLTVDDILKEVRIMRKNESVLPAEKPDFNMKKEEIMASSNTQTEENISDAISGAFDAKKPSIISEHGTQKLKSFLEKTSESDYVFDQEKVKDKVDILFNENSEADIKPFENNNRHSPFMLSPEEIIAGKKKEANKLSDKIHNYTDENKRNLDNTSEIKGFKVIFDDDEADNEIITNQTVTFQKIPDNKNAESTVEFIAKKATDKVEERTVEFNAVKAQIVNDEVKVKDESDKLFNGRKTEPVHNDDGLKINADFSITPTSMDDKVFQKIDKPQRIKKFSRPIKDINIEFVKNDNEQPKNENVIEDYETIEDAESIKVDFETRSSKLSKRLFLSSMISVLLALLTLLPSMSVSLPLFISPVDNTKIFLIVNIALLSLIMLINISSIIRGLFSIFRFKPDIDTAVSVSVIAVFIHSCYAFGCQPQVANGEVMLYSAVAALSIVFNLIGKKCMLSRAILNFEMVATTGIKQSCFVAENDSAQNISEDCVIGQPVLSCSKSVINLHNFLKNTFCEDPADNMCQTLAPIGLIAALIAGGLVYFLTSSLMTALTCLVAIATVCVPLTSLIATNVPLLFAAKKVHELGGMLSGYNAVDDFASTECVAIDAEELFPSGTIDLMSLKSVGNFSIDNVILDAASLAISAGGPLADVFDKIIEGRRKMLPKAKDIFYEDKLGISGIVDGRKIKIGNRELMENGGVIDLPDPELERRIMRNNCYSVYLSSDDILCGMFIVKYNAPDDDIAPNLQRLVSEGITLLIKTNDPNITPELIERLFDISSKFIRVMPSNAVEEYDEITAPIENGDSVLAHDNSIAAFFAGIVTCRSLKTKILIATMLQTMSSILGFGAVMFFALTGNFGYIVPHIIFIYQLICAAVILIIPMLKRL